MSKTKELSSLPTLPSTAMDVWSVVMNYTASPGKLNVVALKYLLARMLMPFANVYGVGGGQTFTKAQWLEYATTRTYWHQDSAKIGDALVVSGTTKDTNQRLVYYFRVTDLGAGSQRYGKCFLLLLEGEPPRRCNME